MPETVELWIILHELEVDEVVYQMRTLIYVYLKRPFPSNLWEESRKPVFGRVIYRQPGFLVENRVLWLQPFFQPLFFPPRWSNGPLVCSLAISKLLEGVGGVASGK